MYPGIGCISRKNCLARNLMRMYKAFPEEYNFFPKTWVIPNESNDLRTHFALSNQKSNKHKTTYIVKPDGMSQGKGIFLSRNIEHILEVATNKKENHLLDDHTGID